MPINHHIYVFTGSLQLFHVFYSNVLNIWNVLITVVERETSKSEGRKRKVVVRFFVQRHVGDR